MRRVPPACPGAAWARRVLTERKEKTVTLYNEVFERTEKKYRLDARQHRQMVEALAGHLALDAFGITKITSLYFDTPGRALIERSLDKPLYKEKLRLRRYGEAAGEAADEDGCVFVEIKKKYKGVVYKRRVGMSLAAARAYMGGMSYEQACACFPLSDPALAAASVSALSRQIAREIDSFRARHGALRPSMVITCDRAAYAPLDAGDGELRITFDTGLAYRDRFDRHAPTLPLLGADEAVMEIKNAGPLPLWLTHALTACGAYPSSFSKYGEAYRICMRAGAAPARHVAGDDRRSRCARSGAKAKTLATSKGPAASAHAAPTNPASASPTSTETTSKERVLDCA